MEGKRTRTRTRTRTKGTYLSGRALLMLAVELRGYYWEKSPAHTLLKPWTVFHANGDCIGGADNLPECRALVVEDFKGFIDEMERGV